MTLTNERTETQTTRSPLGSVVFGVILVGIGVLWLLERIDVIDVNGALVLPGILTVVGAALLVGAWDGAHSGLVVTGVILSVLAMLAAVTPTGSLGGGVGERRHAPTTSAELEDEYTLGVGQLEVDLRGLNLSTDDRVDVRVGAGDVIVRIPQNLPAIVEADVSAGEIVLFGTDWSGLGVSQRWESAQARTADNVLELDIEVVAGKIEVTR
jgi:hypothetical protein